MIKKSYITIFFALSTQQASYCSMPQEKHSRAQLSVKALYQNYVNRCPHSGKLNTTLQDSAIRALLLKTNGPTLNEVFTNPRQSKILLDYGMKHYWLDASRRFRSELSTVVLQEEVDGYAGMMSEDGDLALTISGTGQMHAWQTHPITLLGSWDLQTQSPCPAVFVVKATKGNRILVGLKGREVQLWRFKENSCIFEGSIRCELETAAITPSGDTIIVGDYSGRCLQIKPDHIQIYKHMNFDDLYASAVQPDRSILYSLCRIGQTADTSLFCIDSQGFFAARVNGNALDLYNLSEQHLIQTIKLPTGVTTLSTISFSPMSTRFLAIGDTAGKVHLFNRLTGKHTTLVSFPQDPPPARLRVPSSITWSIDGRYLCIVFESSQFNNAEKSTHCYDKLMTLYDLLDKKEATIIDSEYSDTLQTATPIFSSDSKCLLIPCKGKTIIRLLHDRAVISKHLKELLVDSNNADRQ